MEQRQLYMSSALGLASWPRAAMDVGLTEKAGALDETATATSGGRFGNVSRFIPPFHF